MAVTATKADEPDDRRGRLPVGGAAPAGTFNPLLLSFGGFSLSWVGMMILRRWSMMAAVLGLSLTVALGWLAYVTPLYTASAQILLDTRKHRLLPGAEFVSEVGADANAIATEVSLIRSFAVAARVVERHNLDNVPEFVRTDPAGLISRWRALAASFLSDDQPTPVSGVDTKPFAQKLIDGSLAAGKLNAVRAVQWGTAVKRVATTYFLEISFTHPNPEMAAKIANALVEGYLSEALEAKYQSAQRSTAWLGERVMQLGQQVQNAERAVADHRLVHGLLGTKTASIGEQQAGEINSHLVGARAQVVEKQAKYEQARSILDNGRIESMAEVMASPVILNLRGAEAGVAREEADLLTRYGPEHPSIIKIRAQRSDLRRQIAAELSRVVGSLKTDYEMAMARETTLGQNLGEMRSDSQPLIRLRELEREANASRALYEALLARTKESEQLSGAPPVEVRVIAPALQPPAPTFPSRQGVLALALFGGLGLGVALSLMLDHIENGFLAVEQTERVLQLPVLAMVQHIGEKDRQIEGGLVTIPEVAWRKPLSHFGESIRSIRVATEMSDLDNPPKLVLVTSALPSEGKSTIVQCMAYSAASSKRVLLIDCDLRHPSTTRAFKLDGARGLTDVLAGVADPHEVVKTGPVANLSILSAGSSADISPDILGTDKFANLLQTFSKEYDLVLIDAPPAKFVIDSAILSRRVDRIVYIVHWRTTPQDVVLRTLASLDRTREKIAGIVLNNVQLNKMAGYSKDYAYYGKKYDKYFA